MTRIEYYAYVEENDSLRRQVKELKKEKKQVIDRAVAWIGRVLNERITWESKDAVITDFRGALESRLRPEVEECIRQYGWVFAGVSQPDHRRQWARVKDGKVTEVALEDDLADLAANIVDG